MNNKNNKLAQQLLINSQYEFQPDGTHPKGWVWTSVESMLP